MLGLAVGTRYFDSLDATRTAVRGIDLRALLGESARSHASVAMTRISESTMLLRELGAVCEESKDASADVQGVLNAIADVCFIAQTELNALSSQLRRCEERPDTAVVVAESAYRKLRRITSRTQWLLAPLVGRSADVSEQEQDIVEGGLIVRRLYSAFRKALVPCTDEDASVLPALRSGAQALTALLTDSGSFELRVQDYQILVGLQDRIRAWVRSNGPIAEARRIYADLSAFAELTRTVNNRQELRTHDALMLDTVLRDAFPTMLGDEHAQARLFFALTDLDGLDDMLDALAMKVRTAPTEAAFLDLRLRATQLRGV
jgi:hypothetical protein